MAQALEELGWAALDSEALDSEVSACSEALEVEATHQDATKADHHHPSSAY